MDGQPHILDEGLGYILKKHNVLDVEEIKQELLCKYAKYLMENDHELCLAYILMSFEYLLDRDGNIPDVQTIIREPHMIDWLVTYGTIALKFKRVKNDNLTEDAH